MLHTMSLFSECYIQCSYFNALYKVTTQCLKQCYCSIFHMMLLLLLLDAIYNGTTKDSYNVTVQFLITMLKKETRMFINLFDIKGTCGKLRSALRTH